MAKRKRHPAERSEPRRPRSEGELWALRRAAQTAAGTAKDDALQAEEWLKQCPADSGASRAHALDGVKRLAKHRESLKAMVSPLSNLCLATERLLGSGEVVSTFWAKDLANSRSLLASTHSLIDDIAEIGAEWQAFADGAGCDV